jgi:hypothetical protein
MTIKVTRFDNSFFPPEARSTSTDMMRSNMSKRSISHVLEDEENNLSTKSIVARRAAIGASVRAAGNAAATAA